MEYNPAELILSELASTLGLGLVQMKEIMSRLAERPDNDIFELILYARLLPQPAPAVPVPILPLPQVTPATTASEGLPSTTDPSASLFSAPLSNRASSHSDLTSNSGGDLGCPYCDKTYKKPGNRDNHIFLFHPFETKDLPRPARRRGRSRRRELSRDLAGQGFPARGPVQPQDNTISQAGSWAGTTNRATFRRDDRLDVPHVPQPQQYLSLDDLQADLQQETANQQEIANLYNTPQPQGSDSMLAGPLPQAQGNIASNPYGSGSPAGLVDQPQPGYEPRLQQAHQPLSRLQQTQPLQANGHYGRTPGPSQMTQTHPYPRQPSRFDKPHTHALQARDGTVGEATNITNPPLNNAFLRDSWDGNFDPNTFNTQQPNYNGFAPEGAS